MSRWFRRLFYTDCDICGHEFRKGTGGGVSRRVVCSETCYARAWRNFITGEGPS